MLAQHCRRTTAAPAHCCSFRQPASLAWRNSSWKCVHDCQLIVEAHCRPPIGAHGGTVALAVARTLTWALYGEQARRDRVSRRGTVLGSACYGVMMDASGTASHTNCQLPAVWDIPPLPSPPALCEACRARLRGQCDIAHNTLAVAPIGRVRGERARLRTVSIHSQPRSSQPITFSYGSLQRHSVARRYYHCCLPSFLRSASTLSLLLRRPSVMYRGFVDNPAKVALPIDRSSVNPDKADVLTDSDRDGVQVQREIDQCTDKATYASQLEQLKLKRVVCIEW